MLTEGAVVRPSQALPLVVREDALGQETNGSEVQFAGAQSHDAQWTKTQELEVPDTAVLHALAKQVDVEDAQTEASDAALTEAGNTRGAACLAPTFEVVAESFEREPSAPKLEPVDGAEPLDAAPPESPEGVADESEPPSAPKS